MSLVLISKIHCTLLASQKRVIIKSSMYMYNKNELHCFWNCNLKLLDHCQIGVDYTLYMQWNSIAALVNHDHFLFSLEGQLTSLQAYQTLRNCGTDLIYESPERRIELAHYFWDRILELGKYDNTVTGHCLYSVFIFCTGFRVGLCPCHTSQG